MTNLTTTAINLLAERDGIHPAHMANRLALAIRVVEFVESRPAYREFGIVGSLELAAHSPVSAVRTAIARAVAPASGTLSDETLALAIQIVEAN